MRAGPQGVSQGAAVSLAVTLMTVSRACRIRFADVRNLVVRDTAISVVAGGVINPRQAAQDLRHRGVMKRRQNKGLFIKSRQP